MRRFFFLPLGNDDDGRDGAVVLLELSSVSFDFPQTMRLQMITGRNGKSITFLMVCMCVRGGFVCVRKPFFSGYGNGGKKDKKSYTKDIDTALINIQYIE